MGGMSEEELREEGCPMPEVSVRKNEVLPSMQYDLELIKEPDGTLKWYE